MQRHEAIATSSSTTVHRLLTSTSASHRQTWKAQVWIERAWNSTALFLPTALTIANSFMKRVSIAFANLMIPNLDLDPQRFPKRISIRVVYRREQRSATTRKNLVEARD